MNVSEAGLCFESFAPVERQRRLQFWFSLDLRERVEASGRLAWLDAEGKVGGLRFLDLSARARRHLRVYLGASSGDGAEERSAKLTVLPLQLEKQSPGKSTFELQTSLAVALQKADSAARPSSQASTLEPEPGSESVDQSGEEDTQAKGTVFFAALAAERTLREHPNKPGIGDPTALHEANAGPRDSGGRIGFERDTAQPASISASRQDPTSMVSLERYLRDSRRQFMRGIVLGALASLIIAFVGGRYFGRKPSGSEAGVPSAVAPQPVVAPGRQVSSGASEARAAGVGRSSASNAQVPPTGSAPDKPAPEDVFAPSSPSGAMRRVKETGTSESRGSEAKAARKSNATPQQLWVAVQKGNAAAAVELADRFLQGDGVPVNCDQARVLLLVASEKNNAEAIRKLHELDKTDCPKP